MKTRYLLLILLLIAEASAVITTNRYYYSLTNLDKPALFDNCETTVEDMDTDHDTMLFIGGGTKSMRNIKGLNSGLCLT